MEWGIMMQIGLIFKHAEKVHEAGKCDSAPTTSWSHAAAAASHKDNETAGTAHAVDSYDVCIMCVCSLNANGMLRMQLVKLLLTT